MIIDKQNLFSEDQALTASAVSSNVIDLGNDHAYLQPLNEKGLIEVLAQVTLALTGGTSLQVVLQSDDDVAFGSPTVVLESAVVPAADLVAGYQFKLGKLPRINEQYLRLSYVIVGPFGAGTIFGALVLDRQTNGA